jgi:hypothetical protein
MAAGAYQSRSARSFSFSSSEPGQLCKRRLPQYASAKAFIYLRLRGERPFLLLKLQCSSDARWFDDLRCPTFDLLASWGQQSGYPNSGIYDYPRRNAIPERSLTRLTISWSKDTDLALRSYLGSQGLKKGALSQFIEDAVKWRLLDGAVAQAREAFADLPAEEVDALVEEAVAAARRDMRKE